MSPAHTPVVVAYRGNQGTLGIARTLGRLGVPVHLVAQTGMPSPLTSSRFWREKHVWDLAASRERTLERLLGLGRRLELEHGARPLLLTATDWVSVFVEENADALAERFVFPRSDDGVVRSLADKWAMHRLARDLGIPTPETARPASRDELLRLLDSTAYPVVMKAADPFAAFVPSAAIARSRDEVLAKFDADALLGPPNVVLQEFIPGDAESVWMCNGYFGRDGRCKAVFTGKKLRQLSSTGIASLAECVPNEAVAEQTRAFMEGAGYRGCVGIGWRFDARDGRYKVLDVNARISGVFRLFRATNGMDVVRACYLDLTGQEVGETALTAGRKWALEDELLVARSAIAAGELTVRDWLRSVRGVQETQWFAHDDPLPFLRWTGETARGIAGRQLARYRGR